MIKNFIILLLILITTNYSYGQNNPGLDALIDESTVVVQGTVVRKNCRPPMDLNSAFINSCVIALKVNSTIKGDPKLSILEVQAHINENASGTETIFDTIDVLCFHRGRYNFPCLFKPEQFYDTLDHVDYDALLGDNVIVFLKENNDPYLTSRINIPKDWFVYSLADNFLGIITANDYVEEYLIKREKEMSKSSNK